MTTCATCACETMHSLGACIHCKTGREVSVKRLPQWEQAHVLNPPKRFGRTPNRGRP